AETVSPPAPHLDRVAARGDLHELARRVVDAVLPTQITGVVERHLFAGLRNRLQSPFLDQPREKLAVVEDLERAAVLGGLARGGVAAVAAGRDDLLHAVPVQVRDVLFGQLLEEELVADTPRGVARALL